MENKKYIIRKIPIYESKEVKSWHHFNKGDSYTTISLIGYEYHVAKKFSRSYIKSFKREINAKKFLQKLKRN